MRVFQKFFVEGHLAMGVFQKHFATVLFILWYNYLMKFLRVLFGYIKWHYGRAIISLTIVWKNLAVFLFNYFSIKSLTLNFFSQWKRKGETHLKKSGMADWFETIIINTLMRIVGIIIRTIVILIGLIVWIIFIILFPIALAFWLFIFPAVLYVLLYGIIIFFTIK